MKNSILTRRAITSALLAAGIAALASAPQLSAAQTAYPQKTVRMLVGFPPGTGPDIAARLIAQKLSDMWNGAAIVVDNKAGAGGVIAAAEAARAQPDGYTLMLGETGQLAIAPASYSKLAYDPANDFVPISQIVTNDFALLVNPAVMPARDMKQFVEWAKKQPKGLFMGSFGAGTPGHFGTYALGEAIGLKAEPVHYKSTGDAISAIMSGDVAGAFASMGLSIPQVKGGKMVAIGIAGDERNPAMPDVKTFKEQGLPQVRFQSWYGVFARKGTPPDILERLERDVRRAAASPDVRSKLEASGFTVTATSADEFRKIIADDTRSWGALVRATGFKAD